MKKFFSKKKKGIMPSCPVIVVGNITLGGTGKTPLLIQLALNLKEKGFYPGIISRGYGTSLHGKILLLDETSFQPTFSYPDEALLIWRRTRCPVAMGVARALALKKLLMHHACDIVLSDDGLQHDSLKRDMEIIVVDGMRCFGNQHVLPLGPLREPMARLATVDAIVINTSEEKFPKLVKELSSHVGHVPLYGLHCIPDKIYSVQNAVHTVSLDFFSGKKIYAVCGIGHPERFFHTLETYGIQQYQPIVFPDHYAYQPEDFLKYSDGEIIMTEKDAIKCSSFVQTNLWFLRIRVKTNLVLPFEKGVS